MNTIQLEKILEYYAKKSYKKSFFYGIFALDKLPHVQTFPSCLIMNNQTSDNEGEHWVAIYFDKYRRCEFFDSFGKSPKFYGIMPYLKKYSKSIKFNNKKIQSIFSPYCGLYSVFFLFFKLKGKSMNYYKNLFKKDPIKNDIMFSNWLKRYF